MKAFWATPEGAALRAENSVMAKRVMTGRTRSAATKAKMRARKLGKPHARARTPEWNAKISAAQKGIPRGPQVRVDSPMVTAFGKTQTLARWSEQIGVQYATLYQRLRKHASDPEFVVREGAPLPAAE